jgi:hypothetical protein
MRRTLAVVVALAALVVPTAATAGGWATAGLSPSKPPPDAGPGDTWETTIIVRQHGQTPLAGVEPVLSLTSPESGKRVEFPAGPTDEVGVYRVVARLPAKGTWDVAVYDGFTQYGGAKTHTFGAITVDGGSGGGSSFPLVPSLGGAALILLAAAGLALLIRRQRRTAPVPA